MRIENSNFPIVIYRFSETDFKQVPDDTCAAPIEKNKTMHRFYPFQ